MRSRAALLAVLAVATPLLLGGGPLVAARLAPADAQDASAVPGLIVPDPAECTVAPRNTEALAAFLATPAAEATAAPTAVTIPLGRPADPETVAGITRTVSETFACFNAGDFLRVLGLVTDDFVRQLQADGLLIAEAVPFLAATPVAVEPERRAGYLAITDVSILPDGRVGAFVIEVDPSLPPEGVETDYVVCTRVGDRWLLDEVVEVWTVAEPTREATPAP